MNLQVTGREESMRPSTAPAHPVKSTAANFHHRRSAPELLMCMSMWIREHRQQNEHLQDTLVALLLGTLNETVERSLGDRMFQVEGAGKLLCW
jgi:hypothetical protein